MEYKYAAIYARYSTDSQSATSIEDQIRRCREVAASYGYTIHDEHIYSDAAVSGKQTALHQRAGFKQLLKTIDKQKVSAVFIDEFSRAGRSMKMLADFAHLLSKRNIRLVSADKQIDTSAPGNELILALLGGLSSYELAQTKQRTARGMEGVLKRGGMVGYPPFGYTLDEKLDDSTGNGATWSIHEENAKLVRFMFEARASGRSYQWIATEMQKRGVPCPRRARTVEGGYWRASTVKQLLMRTIYRGMFVWNGSEYTKYKSRKENKVVEQVEYPRPELRLVDDELWKKVQGIPGKTIRRGFKHPLVHRVRCGLCGNTCTLKHSAVKVKMLYCASCDLKKRAGLLRDQLLEIGAKAAMAVIQAALQEVVQTDVREAYKAILTEVASRDNKEHLHSTRSKFEQLDKQIKGLARLLTLGVGDVDEISQKIESLQRQLLECRAELQDLEKESNDVTPEEIDMHVQSMSNDFFSKLLREDVIPPEQGNELIKRIFSSIRFVKLSRADSTWTVEVNLHELAHQRDQRRIFRNGGRVRLTYQVHLYRPRSGSVYQTKLVEKRFIKPEEYQQEIDDDDLDNELKSIFD